MNKLHWTWSNVNVLFLLKTYFILGQGYWMEWKERNIVKGCRMWGYCCPLRTLFMSPNSVIFDLIICYPRYSLTWLFGCYNLRLWSILFSFFVRQITRTALITKHYLLKTNNTWLTAVIHILEIISHAAEFLKRYIHAPNT